jgi:hypothetical protein
MNRGCMATGEVKCDSCQRILEHGERYLCIEEKEGEKQNCCVDCCLDKGYATYIKEKGEKVLTFFPTKLTQ